MPDGARELDPKIADLLDPELARLVQPFDRHNQTLIQNVHPTQWPNPEPAGRYHLVVLGAGTGGLVSAAGAAGLGARVALVERRMMGGDCLNYGCVPSKALISAARAWHDARAGADAFGAPRQSGGGDFGAVMERMRRLRAHISRHDSARRFRDLGIDVFIGEGRFVDPDALEVDGRRLRFRRAIIATGARPIALPIPGLQETGFLTNETLFTLTELPRRLGVIGGGPIGCEIAQAFSRFGSEVTIFDIAPHVLPREDADAAEIVQQALLRDGIRLELGVGLKGIERRGQDVAVTFERQGAGGEVNVDQILLSVGRAPNIDGIGLDLAGVETTMHGVTVDDRLRTSNSRIYAVGDVASQYKFTHVADALARIAIQNSLFYGRAKASDLIVPWCTFTSPEIAHVGLYEEDARQRGLEIDSLTIPLSDVDRAVLDGAEEGFLRLHLAKGKGRILGATVVAEHAGELLGELCLAVKNRVGLEQIASTIHAYPTQAEVIKKAADTWRRGKLTPFVKRVFAAWFKLLR